MKRFLSAILLFVTLAGAAAVDGATFKPAGELEKLFREQHVTGTFVLYDPAADTMFFYNEERARQRFIPASTFKIANSLIGLDVGAVKDVDEVLPYGGKPQWIKAWERDMGLREAIKISNVPIYQELARRIGLERMREGVKKLGYGNMEIGSVVDRFWLDGPLKISAVEQTEFLNRLMQDKLSIEAKAMAAVKEITLLEKTDAYSLHGKTGWGVAVKPQVGWWVGWVERENKFFPFALNIDIMEDKDLEKRISLGRDCLKALGKL